MYTIGCTAPNAQEFLNNPDALEQVYQVASITNITTDNLEALDALVIKDGQNMNKTCELLVSARKRTDIPIWIVDFEHEISKTTKFIYIQLGADGVKDQAGDIAEFNLILKKYLDRIHSPYYQQTENKSSTTIQLIPQNLSFKLSNGKEVALTKLEYLTLNLLYEHVGEAVTYEEIYKQIWNGTSEIYKYRVSNLVFHLREKIEEQGGEPGFIKTVRSKGYMLNI